MKFANKQSGYSLVEVLVAITVLLIALVGPLTIAYSGLKRANFSKEQTSAIFLAQEGTEAIVKLREDAALSADDFHNAAQVWSNTFNALGSKCTIGSSNYCGVLINDSGAIDLSSVYTCSNTNCIIKYNPDARVPYKQGTGATGTDTSYTRRLQISVSGDAYARVKSIVSWGEAESQKIELETYVYNTYYEAP